MKKTYNFLTLLPMFFISCEAPILENFEELMYGSPSIQGKTEYLNSPMVTAGDRVYMVGNQDGSFPELGWHIDKEMGGIWDHPIKWMDGFQVDLIWGKEVKSLNNAKSFVNYPMANKHMFEVEDNNISVVRWQFVPDHQEGMVIELIIKNDGDESQDFQLKFTGFADLRPTWLGERTKMIDAIDQASFNNQLDAWQVKDEANPWYLIFGADVKSLGHTEEQNRYLGMGSANSSMYPISLNSNETKVIRFTIAGSYKSEEKAIQNYQFIQNNAVTLFKAKKNRYEALANQSKLTIPDPKMQETFEWLKYNCDWLVRNVPEVGTGITAGLPDYPWWFGVDSEYALKGYISIGQREAVLSTIHLLDSLSNVTNGNGRIVHEVSTNGAVFNEGNINETPQFASLIWEIYRWTGDQDFLVQYFPTIEKGLDWLISKNDQDKNLFPEGFGMMEIHGMDSEMIDVASYTQRAFEDAAKIATELSRQDLSERYALLAVQMKEKINKEFWSEEFKSYADFIGTDQQALKLIEDAIKRAEGLQKPWAVAELKATKVSILKNRTKQSKPFVMHHNWVVNTPMEMKIADPAKAILALETASKFVSPFGVFVTGIDRDESAGSDDGSFKGTKAFSYTGAVMTLPTGVLAVAENNYGRPDMALNYLKRMTRSFNYALPGSMYEVSPDYGMMTQAWNIYSFAVPIVNQFFGIQPDVAHKTVVINPQMPSEWNNASLENVQIGNNEVSVFYKKTVGQIWIKIVQTQADWSIQLPLISNHRVEIIDGELNALGNTVFNRSGGMQIEMRISVEE